MAFPSYEKMMATLVATTVCVGDEVHYPVMWGLFQQTNI